MKHPYQDEDIIKYIRGQLSGDEKVSFEEEYSRNESLKAEVAEVKTALDAIQTDGIEHLHMRFKQIERKRTLQKWILFALVVIGLIVSGILIFTKEKKGAEPDTNVMYAENFEKYRSPVSIRNQNDSINMMQDGIQAYEANEYGKAGLSFGALCNAENQEACFYAALSSIYGGNMDIEEFGKYLNDDSAYRSILLWYEGLKYLDKKEIDPAITAFRTLDALGNYKQEEVRTILQQLTDNQ